jgi:hypothetical protein
VKGSAEKMPSFIEPMKALPVEELPEGDWLYEVKLDGYRALAPKEGKDAGLVSRNNKPLNYPELLGSLKFLAVHRLSRCLQNRAKLAPPPRRKAGREVHAGAGRPPIQPNRAAIKIRLDNEVISAVDTVAKLRKLDRSRVIEGALRQWLKRDKAAPGA